MSLLRIFLINTKISKLCHHSCGLDGKHSPFSSVALPILLFLCLETYSDQGKKVTLMAIVEDLEIED